MSDSLQPHGNILGFPVPHHLPEFAQVRVHWISDAIQPSHPLSSPSPAFDLSQHQGLFSWGACSEAVWSCWTGVGGKSHSGGPMSSPPGDAVLCKPKGRSSLWETGGGVWELISQTAPPWGGDGAYILWHVVQALVGGRLVSSAGSVAWICLTLEKWKAAQMLF